MLKTIVAKDSDFFDQLEKRTRLRKKRIGDHSSEKFILLYLNFKDEDIEWDELHVLNRNNYNDVLSNGEFIRQAEKAFPHKTEEVTLEEVFGTRKMYIAKDLSESVFLYPDSKPLWNGGIWQPKGCLSVIKTDVLDGIPAKDSLREVILK